MRAPPKAGPRANEKEKRTGPRPFWAYAVGLLGLLLLASSVLFTGSLLYTGFYVEGGGDALLGLIIISPYLLGMMVVGVVLIWVASRVRKRR